MKLPSLFVLAALIASTVFPPLNAADLSVVDPSLNLSAADIEWETIKNFQRPRPPAGPAPVDAQSRAAARQLAVVEFVSQADRLRAFYTANPEHPGSKQARQVEALVLFYAAQSGDNSQEARRHQAVESIRADASIPSAQRAEITAWSRNWEIRKQRDLGPEARLDAYETVTRGLIAEFADVPDAYDSLLQIARNRDNARGVQIAQEVLAMPAPAPVKARARELVDRHALQGRLLADVSKAALGEDTAVERVRGRAVVIYSWASWSPGSIARAKSLSDAAPPGASIVGVSLDTDRQAAESAAATHVLPGEQVYDERGRDGALAQQLKLTEPGLVYITDSNGSIVSVTAARELARPASGASAR